MNIESRPMNDSAASCGLNPKGHRSPVGLTSVGFDTLPVAAIIVFSLVLVIGLVPLLIAAFFILRVVFREYDFDTALTAWSLVLIGAFLLIGYILHRRRVALIRTTLMQYAKSDLVGAVARALALLGTLHPMWVVPTVSQTLTRLQMFGCTLRLWSKSKLPPLVPLEVRIDPIPLDESCDAFEELRSTLASPVLNPHGSAVSRMEIPAPSVSHMMKRWQMLRSSVLLIGLLALGLFFGISVYQRGSVDPFVLFCVVLLAILVSRSHRSRLSQNYEWFIVNGGLVRRTAARNRIASTVRLFDRRSSILCICELRDRSWSVRVADERDSVGTRVTDTEATLLLRAWLSPLAPPPVEKLVDLT